MTRYCIAIDLDDCPRGLGSAVAVSKERGATTVLACAAAPFPEVLRHAAEMSPICGHQLDIIVSRSRVTTAGGQRHNVMALLAAYNVLVFLRGCCG